MTRPEHILFDEQTTAIILGNQLKATQRMLDFDYLCNRAQPSVSCIVNPTGEYRTFVKAFFGKDEIIIPVYKYLKVAQQNHPESDVVINFMSRRSAYQTSTEALMLESIRTVVIIAEGIPERHTRKLASLSRKLGKWIIGPATVGGIVPGKFKIGNAGGAISNMKESKLYRPGSVGFVSKSGGMLNEMANVISLNSNGLYEGVAIGGDSFPGSNLYEHVLRYEANPEIKLIVLLGEVGGTEEYKVAEAIRKKEIKKPVVAWVTGTCSKVFPSEVQFGHAGAMAKGMNETADAKNNALREAGAIVPESFDSIGEAIKNIFGDIGISGATVVDSKVREIPVEYDPKSMRRPTVTVSTISDDRQDELLYAGVPISKIIREGYSIGDVVSLLWFKKRLPAYVSEFFDLVLKLTADHGPCVSGAHNAIITTRAGKDLTAAVASGVLTIGPRFGGAIDDAAKYFKEAVDKKMTPMDFIKSMKDRGMNIPGIGHRVKSLKNPDMRVKLLKDWTFRNLKDHTLLDFAMEVEQITTTKKENLILNVDGCIGILFVDILKSTGQFSDSDIDNIIKIGTLNGFFVLGRTIGLIGHYLDQKRLNSSLYRQPWDEVLYL